MESQYPTKHNGFSFTDFLGQVCPEMQAKSNAANPIAAAEQGILNIRYKNYLNGIFFDLNKERICVDRGLQLPEKSAYAFQALVLSNTVDGLMVGFVNPYDQEVINSVSSILNAYIKPVIVKQKDLSRILRLTYRKTDEIQKYANSIIIRPNVIESFEIFDNQEDDVIADLAHLMIRDAIEIEASDVHIEVNRDNVNIRLRVDGVLQKYSLNNVAVGDHLVRYFKLLADVDITQDQRPSEGKKVTIILDKDEINFRVSFMPTYDGQSVVIRILGKAESYRLAEKIHHAPYLDEIQEYLSRSYGMFLISGPTGSGKTTTLYSAIQEINATANNIITLEDPVEAKIPNANQIQVNELINYTFSDGLRAALRQDPDVIMIGEIRDEITANMAVRAAITGHLVLSTVHARGVAEIPIRLLNLKVDPYLLASALRLTASQRLVRKVCENCKEVAVLTQRENKFLDKHSAIIQNMRGDTRVFYQGKGCYYCQGTGFSQREAILEVLHMTPDMITFLAQNKIPEYMELVKTTLCGKTILDHSFSLALSGNIPLSEVMRMESD